MQMWAFITDICKKTGTMLLSTLKCNIATEKDEELMREVDRMILDRRTLFDTDPRFIEHIEVKRKNDKLAIEAQSRLIPDKL